MQIVDIPEFTKIEKLVVLSGDILVKDAAKNMKTKNVTAALILDNGKPYGIFTESDLLLKVVAEDLDLNNLKLKEVMSKRLVYATIHDNVIDAMQKMREGKFRHLPIVAEDGKVVGMVFQKDFVATNWDEILAQMKTHAKASFFTHTQIWMLAISILIYTIILLFFVK